MLYVVLGLVVLVVIVVLVARSGGGLPSRFPPGSRAFEAELTLGPLTLTIEQRKRDLAAVTDPGRRAKLEKQIAFLEAQVVENQKIMANNDLSPGRGYIGFTPPPED